MEESKYSNLLKAIRQNDMTSFKNEVENLSKELSSVMSLASIHYVNSPNDTLLHFLAQKGRAAMIQYLVDKSDHKILIDAPNSEGKTPLHEAAQFLQVDVVKILIELRADVDALKRGDWTPLMLVCAKTGDNAIEIVKILIKSKAKLGLTNKDGWTAFHIAARAGDLETLKVLFESNPNSTFTESKNGRTPLHTASMAGRYEAVKFIVDECRHKVEAEDSCGVTPLMDGVKSGNLPVIEYLLSKGCSIQCKDLTGMSIFDLACLCGKVCVVEYLLGKYELLDVEPPIIGPLHFAAKAGHSKVLEFLLSKKQFSTKAFDNQQRTAIDYSTMNDHVEATKVLLRNSDNVLCLQFLHYAKSKPMQNMIKEEFKQNRNLDIFFPSELS